MTQGAQGLDDGEALGGVGGRGRAAGEVGAKGGEFAAEGGFGGDGAQFDGGLPGCTLAGDLDAAGIGVGEDRDAVAAVEADFPAFFAVAVGDFKNGPRGGGAGGIAEHTEEADAAPVETFGESEARRGNVAEDKLGDGDVVGGEVPGAVHVGAGAGPVGAGGAQAVDGAELGGAGDGGESFDAGMVAPDVADKELFAGAGDQFTGLGEIGGEGFFAEDGHAARGEGGDDGGVGGGGGGDDDAVDGGQSVQGCEHIKRPGGARGLGGGGAGFDHGDGVAEGEEVAVNITSPDAVADEGEMLGGHGRS